MGKTVSGITTNYLYDGANVAQELSGGAPTANLLSGGLDEVFTRTDASGAGNFLTDALGSTVALADATGVVQTSYIFEPFGNTTVAGAASTGSYQYIGRENDGTGLYFYRARYYSPILQRFVSEDPISFAGGDTNLYALTWNSPLNFVDPPGTTGFGLTGGGNIGIGMPFGVVGTAGAGAGVFWGKDGVNTGGFGQAGGFAGFGPLGPRYPDGKRGFGSPWAFGADAGVGLGGFLTNASSVCDLEGPFNTTILAAGIPGLSLELQFGYSHGIWIASLTGSPYGVGALLSNLTTKTWPKPFSGRNCGC